MANRVLKEKYPRIPYIEIVNKEGSYGKVGIKARFECGSVVACFDISPEMDYMVCECVDRSVQLWSLQSGDRLWLRYAFTEKSFGIPIYAMDCAVRNVTDLVDNDFGWGLVSSMSFYRSVVFHADGDYVIPGSLRDVFTINGDLQPLFPESDCMFNVCAFCGDRSKMLTDCPENPRDVVLWSMSDGVEITRFECTKNMTSFAFSFDGTLVAISDKSDNISLYKLSNISIQFICDIACPRVCSLMHFSPDNREILFGFAGDNASLELDCYSCKVPSFSEDSIECPETAICFQEIEDIFWWPWECRSLDESKFLFSESRHQCDTMISEVIPSFKKGFLSALSNQSVVVCSPFNKEMFMIHHDQFEDCPGYDSCEREIGRYRLRGKLSVDGRYLYAYRERRLNDRFFSTVHVCNKEKKTVRQFQSPLYLLPVREGVLLMKNTPNNLLELWDFELSRCIRSFTEIDTLVSLFPVTDELVGCQRPCENNSSKVDVLSITIGGIVATTTMEGNITSLSCNLKFQFVACTKEEPRSVRETIITIAVWNKKERLWKRNILTPHVFHQPCAIISNDGDFVVTWNSLDEADGLHILNATTGITMHKLLSNPHFRPTIEECKLLSDGEHFLCSCPDQVVRLFHGNSGNLIGLIDLERNPDDLAVCLNKPLFAAVFDTNSYGRIFQVHLPKVENSESKVKRMKLQQ